MGHSEGLEITHLQISMYDSLVMDKGHGLEHLTHDHPGIKEGFSLKCEDNMIDDAMVDDAIIDDAMVDDSIAIEYATHDCSYAYLQELTRRPTDMLTNRPVLMSGAISIDIIKNDIISELTSRSNLLTKSRVADL